MTELLSGATRWVRTAQSELLEDHIVGRIHDKSTTVDLAFYELPEYYDHLHRARSEASYRPLAMLESMANLLQSSITLLGMVAVLIPFGLWLPAALLVSTLPAFYVVLRYGLLEHQWRLGRTADERRVWYYDWLLTARESASEMRLFGLGRHFQSLYQGLRGRLRGERLKLVQAQSLAELKAGAAALLISAAALGWMVWRALQGVVTLGDLALFYQAFNQGQRLMRLLLENLGQIAANSRFLGDLFEFLELKPQVESPRSPSPVPRVLQKGVSFHQVRFGYPGSERTVLHDFSLTIPPGQITAVVGPNGAGKTTLIKLICRLYDPQYGHVDFDGINLRDFSLQELRRAITVLFQEPVRYNTTVAENIILGDLNSAPDREKVQAAARAARADELIERLPDGYDTLLGKWFVGGTELSFGEWQRLSLARAFLRQAPVILLDEPTSAMDSWAEVDWLRCFSSLATDRTALIITHRFTTAMHADLIHVMVDGRIVESGSHEELVTRGGRYAESWKQQIAT